MATASINTVGSTGVNRNQLFWLSCISLIVTAMTFAIRAGILTQLSEEFALSDTQLGWVNSMAFLGFPLAMVVFGFLYNKLGPRLIMILAFAGHLLGLVLTILADGFLGLLISTFFIGFANGSVEAACNPLVADLYRDEKTKWLNRFHVWFPGGIVIGAVISYVMTNTGIGWQPQIAVMLIPTAIYGFMIFTTKFPDVPASEKTVDLDAKGVRLMGTILGLLVLIGTPNNLVAGLPGTFILPLLAVLGLTFMLMLFRAGRTRDALLLVLLMAIMSVTATSELGTQQWVDRILGAQLGNLPGQAMIVLGMVTGIMAVGRYFAGPLIHALNPLGVLLMSAVLTTIGLLMMASASGAMVYASAIVFALGVCYFWPTMIGVTAQYVPRSGALGMSLVGAAGMFALTIWNPIIGGWIDSARANAEASGLTGTAVDVAAGQGALSQLVYFPVILIAVFAALYFARKQLEMSAEEA
ncbi:MFS transporter [Erythrobacter crassostreae]|uniref:MFS transporter n=1 Tax=Erythrobacter crassostreae TaxID=2828328 RepID=A0A9X1F501_9SPHN|nr:MFS transporter [Erythrobacter crassostrea]MBV7260341.1 MFS transporter [Erythrobacter crassostrea]